MDNVAVFLLFSTSFWLLAQPLTFDGTLYDAEGTPIEESQVTLQVSLLESTGMCILFEEQFSSLDLSASKGYFSLNIGSGTPTANDSGHSLETVLSNESNTLSCMTTGGSVSSKSYYGAFESRKIQLSVTQIGGITINEVKLPAQTLKQNPYALHASNSVTANIANELTGFKLDATPPLNGQTLVYNSSTQKYEPSHTSASATVEWTNVQNRPIGLDDGDNDSVSIETWTTLTGKPACSDGEIMKMVTGVWTCQPDISVPTGAVMAFNLATCPDGWSEVTAARGRVVVGQGDNGVNDYTLASTGGADSRTLSVGQLPAHNHSVDPPNTATNSTGNHRHSVDPPNTATTTNGSHSHGLPQANTGFKLGSGGSGWHTNSMGWIHNSIVVDPSGNHQHTVNIAPFNSAYSGTHSHNVNIAAFDSGNRGSGDAIDMRQAYISFLYCQKD